MIGESRGFFSLLQALGSCSMFPVRCCCQITTIVYVLAISITGWITGALAPQFCTYLIGVLFVSVIAFYQDFKLTLIRNSRNETLKRSFKVLEDNELVVLGLSLKADTNWIQGVINCFEAVSHFTALPYVAWCLTFEGMVAPAHIYGILALLHFSCLMSVIHIGRAHTLGLEIEAALIQGLQSHRDTSELALRNLGSDQFRE